MKLLFLYDTTEEDLARDLKALLEQLINGSIIMIPLEPNQGSTLEGKEKRHFDVADAALFLITAGSEREGNKFPSPSVNHELGQAKRKWEKTPERVICLVERGCNMPTIDQQAYIPLKRDEMRSVLKALTLLIKEFKEIVEIFQIGTVNLPVKEALSISDPITSILIYMSHQDDGLVIDRELKLFIRRRVESVQAMNLAIQDLEKCKAVKHYVGINYNYWQLTKLGWEFIGQFSKKLPLN